MYVYLDKLYWLQRPVNTTVLQGKSVKLHCEVTGKMMPVYNWYHQVSVTSMKSAISSNTNTVLSIEVS